MIDVCRRYAESLQMYAEVGPIELLLNFPYTSHKISVNFKPAISRVSLPGYATLLAAPPKLQEI